MEDHSFEQPGAGTECSQPCLRTDQELTAFYERNVKLVYMLCYLYLKSAADAEDAVQTVFIKLLQTDILFQSREHERAWLITTAKNHCRDLLKSWWRRRRVDWDSLPEAASQEDDPQIKELLAGLLALPEKYRIVLHLHYLEGYSVREIAALLERNESTIRSQLLRGREKLKTDLGGRDFGQKSCGQNI